MLLETHFNALESGIVRINHFSNIIRQFPLADFSEPSLLGNVLRLAVSKRDQYSDSPDVDFDMSAPLSGAMNCVQHVW